MPQKGQTSGNRAAPARAAATVTTLSDSLLGAAKWAAGLVILIGAVFSFALPRGDHGG
jgi:hypothetical protein